MMEQQPTEEPQGMVKPKPVAQPLPGDQAIPADQEKAEQIEGGLVNDGEVEMGPGQEMQLDAYSDNATIAVFSKESQPAILQSLQAKEDPVDSISDTALIVHQRLEASLSKGQEKMTEITMALGAAHLVSELIVLAEAAKLYTLNQEQRMDAYKFTLMKYFEKGLADGSIEAVELQKMVEPLLTEDQRAFGEEHAEREGLSKTAPPSNMHQRPQQQPPEQQPQQQGILRRPQ